MRVKIVLYVETENKDFDDFEDVGNFVVNAIREDSMKAEGVRIKDFDYKEVKT